MFQINVIFRPGGAFWGLGGFRDPESKSNLAHVTRKEILHKCAKFGGNPSSSFWVYKSKQTHRHTHTHSFQIYIVVR